MIKLLLLLNVLVAVTALKILGVFPHPGKSHTDVFKPLMKGLSDKGHEVTVISQFPLKQPLPNYTDVVLENPPLVDVFDMKIFNSQKRTMWEGATVLKEFAFRSCESAFESKSFQNFLKVNTTFDVVIIEFFNSDCFFGLFDKFKAPVIGLSSSTLMPWTSERFANPTHPAYIPNNLMSFSDKLTFFERVENLLAGLYHGLYFNFVLLAQDDAFNRRFFGANLTPVRDMILRSSLVLVNTHFSLNLPRPLVPAVVEVGGIHLAQRQQLQLSQNIEKWINESTHGIIYFSLGSMIKGHTFPEEKRRAFLKAFGRFPQRILWKWENDTMPGKPENVMIQKWMPQLDILCHPNVKAFISHGGLLGTIEAVHCGVPTVVMPQYGDQHTNARALEENGGGVVLKLHEADEEKIYNALKTVLDPNFRKGARELSERFRDRPLPPLETAIYWVEYVARHRGAHHMRTAAVDMPFYKYLLLDVIAFLLLVLAVFSTILFYFTRALFRKLFAKGQKQKAS